LKGEWPKSPKLDVHPMVAKVPAFSRPLVSTIGHNTSAQLTNEKGGDSPRGNQVPNRDFKVKSIDGLKLTVKTDLKSSPETTKLKRKRRETDELMTKDKVVEDEHKIRVEEIRFVKKKRMEGLDTPLHTRSSHLEKGDSRRNVQVSKSFACNIAYLSYKYIAGQARLFL